MAGQDRVTAALRLIAHPGPRQPDRSSALACQAVPVQLHLRAGQSLAQAVAAAFAQAGFAYGYLRLDGAVLAPLHFVIPAPSPDGEHAAWYSATRQMGAAATIRSGGAHLGLRDGAPFVHCHGLWDGPDNRMGAGHILCDQSRVAQDCTLSGWGLLGAGLVARYDEETRFTLFQPTPQGTAGAVNACLVTLRPNQDILSGLQAVAAAHGIAAAQVEGIGSLVATQFDDCCQIDSFATEILILDGGLTGGTDDGCATLRVASVGFDGDARCGQLVAGANAICVTAELLVLDMA